MQGAGWVAQTSAAVLSVLPFRVLQATGPTHSPRPCCRTRLPPHRLAGPQPGHLRPANLLGRRAQQAVSRPQPHGGGQPAQPAQGRHAGAGPGPCCPPLPAPPPVLCCRSPPAPPPPTPTTPATRAGVQGRADLAHRQPQSAPGAQVALLGGARGRRGGRCAAAAVQPTRCGASAAGGGVSGEWGVQQGRRTLPQPCRAPTPAHCLPSRRRQLPAAQRAQPAGGARRLAGQRRRRQQRVGAAAGRRGAAAAAGADGAGHRPVPDQPGRGAAPGGAGLLQGPLPACTPGDRSLPACRAEAGGRGVACTACRCGQPSVFQL